jgi:DNA-binding FadR family transcriptional regulator
MIVGKTASEIFDNIRHLVQSGVFKPGDVLPPVRELAGKLTVNRNTVAAAYKRLVTSGWPSVRGVMVPPLKRIIPFPRWKAAIPLRR